MTLDIGDALSRGFSRTVARNGLLLVALTYVLNAVNGLVGPRTTAMPGPGSGMMGPLPGGMTQPVVGVPLVADVLLALFVGLAGMVVSIGALRLFVGAEREELSAELFTRNGVWALLNFVAGSVVFGLLVVVGFVLLVLPGVFLLTTLFYWPVFVAVEDENFAEALQSSWELTEGSRLRVFLLGLVFVTLSFLVSVVFGLPALVLGSLGVLVSTVGTAFVTILGDAVLASAYLQLEAESEGESTEESESGTDGTGAVPVPKE